ncbi:DNA internalization-related competence protein ComEC/Rec2 [Inediibacterium massiliense]|uniref:DNA internalization-related competence protein ComEC/Rec2 n=1 Tax=Inediibacterium massiliense TaxID=1658111 RepID=UPI0006B64705|nr:DNA internalization-related competence protein ComEC/Rec2 [Inediibacterium massiliense]
MRRPLFWISIFYIIGIVYGYLFSPSYISMIFLFLIGCVFIIYTKKTYCFIFLFCILLGIFLLKIDLDQKSIYDSLENESIEIIGDVVDIDYKKSTSILLKATQVVYKEKIYKVYDKVLIKYKEKHMKFDYIVGKRVFIKGKVTKPKGRRNPNMFDYSMYLKMKKIDGVVYSHKIKILGEGKIFPIWIMSKNIKNKLIYFVQNIMPKEEGDMLLGIILGNKEGLDEKVYKTFQRVGVAHILAVSGMHVGILYLFSNKLLKRFPVYIRIVFQSLILWAYAFITGGSSSVVRAVLMLHIFFIAPLLNRRYDSLSGISAIAFLLLIINPMYIIDMGFVLSFSAAFSIIILYKPIDKKLVWIPNKVRKYLVASIAAQIGTMPIVAYHFFYISFGAFIVNIPVAILAGLIVPMGFIMIIIGFFNIFIASLLGIIISYLLKIMIFLCNLVDHMPFSSIEVVSPYWTFFLFYYGSIAFWISKRKFKMSKNKIIGMITGIYIVSIGIYHIIPAKMQINFLDVGQGDCILIQTPMHKNILIDGGGSLKKEIDIGENVVVPCLRRNGIGKINMMFLSHAHKDHIDGLIRVFDHMKVHNMFIGANCKDSIEEKILREKCRIHKTRVYEILRNDTINIEQNLSFQILHPKDHMTTLSEANNDSLVMLMKYKGVGVLFTGDIEKETEEEIVKEYSDLHVDILKVGHHGSATSSTDVFIQHIKPRIGVIQVGKNHFGHPNQSILDEFSKNKVKIFRNDENGAVIMVIDKNKVKVNTME